MKSIETLLKETSFPYYSERLTPIVQANELPFDFEKQLRELSNPYPLIMYTNGDIIVGYEHVQSAERISVYRVSKEHNSELLLSVERTTYLNTPSSFTVAIGFKKLLDTDRRTMLDILYLLASLGIVNDVDDNDSCGIKTNRGEVYVCVGDCGIISKVEWYEYLISNVCL